MKPAAPNLWFSRSEKGQPQIAGLKLPAAIKSAAGASLQQPVNPCASANAAHR
jgi:hypothetical protein